MALWEAQASSDQLLWSLSMSLGGIFLDLNVVYAPQPQPLKATFWS